MAGLFKGVAEFAVQGQKFAQDQATHDLRKEQHKLSLEQNKRTAESHEIKKFQSFMGAMEGVSKMTPSMGKAQLKTIMPQWEKMGYRLDPASEAGLFESDPAVAQARAEGFVNFRRAFTSGSSADLSKAIKEVQPFVSKGDLNSMLKDAAAQGDRLNQIEAQGKVATEQTNLRIGAATEANKIKAEADITKVRKVDIGNLRNEAEEVRKELSPAEDAIRKMDAIVAKDPKFNNPQTGIALVRLFSATTEAQKSVVRQSEFETIAGAASLFDSLGTRAQRYIGTDVKVVPARVLSDIVKTSASVNDALKRIRIRRLTPIFETIKQQGFQKEAGQILGRDARLLNSRKDSQKAAQTKLNLSNLEKNIIARAKKANGGNINKDQLKRLLNNLRKRKGTGASSSF
jgi:hypothetical protein